MKPKSHNTKKTSFYLSVVLILHCFFCRSPLNLATKSNVPTLVCFSLIMPTSFLLHRCEISLYGQKMAPTRNSLCSSHLLFTMLRACHWCRIWKQETMCASCLWTTSSSRSSKPRTNFKVCCLTISAFFAWVALPAAPRGPWNSLHFVFFGFFGLERCRYFACPIVWSTF